ncbi:antitoxin Xre/MbcA/ParS toxin-binding domain-containing protein [Phaeobacter inhibens]|uniref:antitoxin Xre/MbcA/ParS toxin-binding domain-containing protein n=1 Tax=Phaeobacter inhibens TaxID=221822 RepID=UPI0020C7F5FC|nr:antitoxin Xre/MbcA/ParS toxin-binding domain-containing protein [Phaeobacter inhibens]
MLSVEQGSRAWRFAGILARASDILGGQAAEMWILDPAIGLENRRPIDLLASAAGAEAVEDFLTRMEYGIYT